MDNFAERDASLQLLDEIGDGAQLLGIAPSTLCQKAVQNASLVKRLREGGSVTLKTARRIRDFIQANRPKDVLS